MRAFSFVAAALTGVLVQNDIVEGIAQDLGLALQVNVAAVARAADDDAAPARRHAIDRVDKRLDGIGVVAVVGDQCGPAVRKYVEAPRCRMGIIDE